MISDSFEAKRKWFTNPFTVRLIYIRIILRAMRKICLELYKVLKIHKFEYEDIFDVHYEFKVNK